MRRSSGVIIAAALLVAMTLQAPAVQAQKTFELGASYGSVWGGNIKTNLGTFRVDTGDSWSFSGSLLVQPSTWAEFSYARQGTRINRDWLGARTTLTDMDVEFWQLGVVRGLPKGNVTPYVIGTLGLTHFIPDAGSVDLGGTDYAVRSATKFSMSFGVGFKAYVGQEQRVGLRAQIRVLPTLYDAGAGLWFGTGGGGLAVTGSAVWQYEVSGGVVVKLGQ